MNKNHYNVAEENKTDHNNCSARAIIIVDVKKGSEKRRLQVSCTCNYKKTIILGFQAVFVVCCVCCWHSWSTVEQARLLRT